LYGETQPDGGGAEEAAEGGEVEEPGVDLGGGDLGGGDLGGGEEGGAGLELASINKSKLPLILENLDNNNFTVDLEKGKNKLDEVTNKVDSLLTE